MLVMHPPIRHCEAPQESKQSRKLNLFEIKSQTPEETAAIAQKIASLLHSRDVVLLKGDLGSGKSTFARALIQALCGEETEVPSPTFTLVQTYETPDFALWHFDLISAEKS